MAAPRPYWRGAYEPHGHLSPKNLLNALLALCCMAPSIWAALQRARCDPSDAAPLHADFPRPCELWRLSAAGLSGAPSAWCEMALSWPILSVNWLFFWNVTLGFWLIGLLQRSFWLIDPYWTLLPPLIGLFYASHPLAEGPGMNNPRLLATLGLVGLWSMRLTHSYFRREEWKFGQREDWRYTEMSERAPRAWALFSFFAVGLAQQPMLVGVRTAHCDLRFEPCARPAARVRERRQRRAPCCCCPPPPSTRSHSHSNPRAAYCAVPCARLASP
jgi:hypothetical protein